LNHPAADDDIGSVASISSQPGTSGGIACHNKEDRTSAMRIIVYYRIRSTGPGASAQVLDAQLAAAHAHPADPRILELDRKLPWQSAVFAHDLRVLHAVYPVPDGTSMVDAMPRTPGSYASRLPLPAAWAGLRDAALAAATGVPDAVFVHPQRFVGAARSRAGALALAHQAIALGDGTAAAPLG
jgi:uncharacterized UPF0160 family protein